MAPGTVEIVSIPASTSTGWTANSIGNNVVRAYSDDEFIAYMVNIKGFTSDAALALPLDTMNTEYIVLDYNPRFVGSMFVVHAGYDNTEVTITPTTAIVGHPAGVPFTVNLDRGEGYFARSSSTAVANTLTGTTVSADRPVGLTNGNGCTQVPAGTNACDHIFEVAQPVQSWGNEIGVANLPQRAGGTIYRILASEDTTAVMQDGVALVNLNAGEFHETSSITGNHSFTADKPIYVAQFMTGDSAPGANDGDPAMGNMIPFAQYQDAYTFSTVGGSQFATNYVTIIAANADLGTLLLDGVPIPAVDYTPVPATAFSAVVKSLTQGSHTTSSTNGHGITVEGFNNYDSYIYPGGALFTFINPVGDENAPIVDLDDPAGDPPSIDGEATDDRPSEDVNDNGELDPGEDLNGNEKIDEDTGIFFVELAAGSTNVVLNVNAFVPGDDSATFTIDLIDGGLDGSGTIVVTDGAGNESTEDFEIIANSAPDCSSAGSSVGTLWPPNHKMVAVEIEGVTDADGDSISINIDGITQDEPVNAKGDGNFAPDGDGVGTSVAQLRAERTGVKGKKGSNGRVYVVSYTATDGEGGECSGTASVGVPHDQKPGNEPVDDGQVYDSTDAS